MSEGSKAFDIMRELGMSLGQPTIAVVGCGGAGNNVVDSVYWECHGVHTVVLNTDAEKLKRVNAHKKIELGSASTSEECCRLAEESSREIKSALQGNDIVFVIAGLGGATGSGTAPVVAKIAQEEGAVVFSIPIMPFSAEGNRREAAEAALESLRDESHSTIPLDNEKLLGVCSHLPISGAFKVVNQSVVKLIEKVYEHSSSYVSDLIDDVSGGFASLDAVVEAEHEIVVEEMPMTAVQANLGPSLEFPFETHWNDMMFG